MPPFTSPNSYTHHRVPAERISRGVWLYDRFCLSSRDVEELRFARGVMVTYDAIRQWGQKFGQASANQRRRRPPRRGDKWHLEAVFLTIRGERPSRWRAVDQDGEVLDSLVQRWRDQKAATRCFRTRRALPSAAASARTTEAGVQVARTGPTVPCRLGCARPTLPPETPPASCPYLSPNHGPTVSDVARRHGDCSRLRGPIPRGDTPSCLMSRSAHNKLTMPCQVSSVEVLASKMRHQYPHGSLAHGISLQGG